MHLAPSICYEDAFGSAQLDLVKRSDLLVNVTNDAWFGHSPARYQHLQISRMRALEADRYLLRAANDGVSAIIGPRGDLISVAPEYRSAVLRGTVVAPQWSIPVYTGRQLGGRVRGPGRARRGLVPAGARACRLGLTIGVWSNLAMANEFFAPRTVGLVLMAAMLSALLATGLDGCPRSRGACRAPGRGDQRAHHASGARSSGFFDLGRTGGPGGRQRHGGGKAAAQSAAGRRRQSVFG